MGQNDGTSFPNSWRKVCDFSWLPLSCVQSLSLSVSLCVSQEQDLWAPGAMCETSGVSLVPVSLSCPGAQFLPQASSPWPEH